MKQYALVDVKKYSIVSTGTTQKETLSTYRKLLKENGIETSQKEEDLAELYKMSQITVKDIKYVNVDGETVVYITDTEGNVYKQQFSSDETLVFIQVNDKITIYYEENEKTGIRQIETWKSVQ